MNGGGVIVHSRRTPLAAKPGESRVRWFFSIGQSF
jgi:hypothetical protein